jgi:hypothetical protein
MRVSRIWRFELARESCANVELAANSVYKMGGDTPKRLSNPDPYLESDRAHRLLNFWEEP